MFYYYAYIYGTNLILFFCFPTVKRFLFCFIKGARVHTHTHTHTHTQQQQQQQQNNNAKNTMSFWSIFPLCGLTNTACFSRQMQSVVLAWPHTSHRLLMPPSANPAGHSTKAAEEGTHTFEAVMWIHVSLPCKTNSTHRTHSWRLDDPASRLTSVWWCGASCPRMSVWHIRDKL